MSGTIEEEYCEANVLTLTHKSFPMVCTFEQFLQLLENTVIALDRQNFQGIKSTTCSSRGPQLVDFYTFQVDYWQSLPHTLTKGFSVHLVFAEIMGVIKGSEASTKSLIPLTREEYLERSSRLAPSFTEESERLRVYEIFEKFEEIKHERDDFDYIDRVVKILKNLRQKPSLQQTLRNCFDEVYIDEVQDHRSLDLELLLSIVRDGRGFHFAGDTAQAISQDSMFRFADVKKMLFDNFAVASTFMNQKELGHAEMFLLSKNYRSHQGILALASLIMEMMWTGFPETIDKLQPEVGSLSGPKPVLFIGCDAGDLLSNHASSGTLSERSSDFGAEQVILVRDPSTKTKLQNETQHKALIFTILESKGMEFDDVLLWNFFTDCPDQAGVRALPDLQSSPRRFDSKKHSAMCSELKHLYVAVTRARIQLFIFENSSTTAQSVQRLFTDTGHGSLIEVTQRGQEDFAIRLEMMRPSNFVDRVGWAKRADDLMRRRMFREAIMPFRRSGDRRGEMTAKGFLEEEESRLCLARKDSEGSTRHLEVAYTHFSEAKLIGDTVRVLVRMGCLEKAAEVWLANKQPSKAARLFLEAGLPSKAFQCHHDAGEWSEAAQLLREEKEYDRLVAYIVENEPSFPSKTLEGYSLLCKLLLKQKKLSSVKSQRSVIKLLGSPEAQEKCFLEYGMNEDLVSLYRDQRRYVDLFHLYSRTGQLESAFGLALTKKLLSSGGRLKESDLLNMLDFLWAQHLLAGTHQSLEARLESSSTALTPKMALNIQQWRAIKVYWKGTTSGKSHLIHSLDNTTAKRFLCLHKILYHSNFAQVTDLDTLPLEMAYNAIDSIKDSVTKDGADGLLTISLITGLWMPCAVKSQLILLPWSPLARNKVHVNKADLVQTTKSWVFDSFASSILALDTKARQLWITKWPERCALFLTRSISPLPHL